MHRNRDNPSTTFFWNDWDNEPGMKFCCLAAQGLWLKMLSLAARSREPGVVLIGDHPSLRQDLPALLESSCGGSAQIIDKLIGDLVTFKVASVDDRGRVFNRRMVAEAKLSAARSEAGRKGANVANGKRQMSGKGGGKQGGNGGGKPYGKTQGDLPPTSVGPAALDGHGAGGTARQTGDSHADKTAPSSVFCLSSVPNGTGAEAPRPADNLELPPFLDRRLNQGSAVDNVDIASIVFNRGLDWLLKVTGKSDDTCRKLLGKWRRDFGNDGDLIATIGKAQREAPIDPVGWMEGAIRARRGNGQQPSPRAAWAENLP
jgi:hypothetical protein